MSMFPFHIEGYRAERISKCINAVPSEYESVFTFPESLGDFVSTGETDHDQFTSIEDGNPVVLTYNNFTVQAGHTVTPTNRCKGLYLNILGDLTVDGTLSMTARGASAEGRYVIVTLGDTIYYCTEDPGDLTCLTKISAVGGIGESTGAIRSASKGAPGINGACASGGNTYRKGGNGTSFSGGPGAGGLASNNDQSGISSTSAANGCTAGSDSGGSGGNGAAVNNSYGGGGAGNPGGIGSRSRVNAPSGTGGLMILKVHGNVYITGSIQSNGTNGQNGHGTVAGAYPGSMSGCGSGGGAIHLFHKGSITGSELVTATGGSKGATGLYKGADGGDGTINIVKI